MSPTEPSVDRWVAVARILGAHGIQGEVAVVRFGEEGDPLLPGKTLTAKTGSPVLRIESRRPAPKGRWLVRFEGVDDRDKALALRGLELGVDAGELPELDGDRYYDFEIIGLTAVTETGEELGRVDEVWDTGANDVFVVHGPRGEILLPAIGPVIREIDKKAGRIVVDVLPGLLPEDS